MTRFSIAVAVLLLAFVGTTTPLEAGVVTGTIDLPPRPWSSAGASLYDKYGSVGGETDQDSETYAAVLLRPKDRPQTKGKPRTLIMDQKGAEFVPRLLVIQAGESVAFRNSDPIFHNVFSLSPAKRFDLGRYPKGDVRVIRFDTAGVVKVFCDIHAQMMGFIVISDTPHHTPIEPSGHYRISKVPPGNYDVLVWLEGRTQFEIAGEVQVPSHGEATFTASIINKE